MRLLRNMSVTEEHTSPCNKSELVVGLRNWLGSDVHSYPPLDKCTRAHLLEIAEELGILIHLEERARVVRILRAIEIDFDLNAPTYMLVNLAIDVAIDRYGVADLEALRKNLKRSPFRRVS